MPDWINDNKIYKPVYAFFCLIASAVISVFAGFDYGLSLLNQSETIKSSYGELLIALILTISGVIVLVSRKNHLHMIVCLGLVLMQVTSFFFCKYIGYIGTTERISVIKWIPLVTAVFTMLLIESKKKESESADMERSNNLSITKKIITVIFGVILTGSGVCAHFQSGVLKADQTFYSYNGNYVVMFLSIGLVMLINGVLLLFFMTEKIHKAVSASMIMSLIISASYLLVRGIGSIQVLVSYLVFYTVIMFLSAICVLFVQLKKQ